MASITVPREPAEETADRRVTTDDDPCIDTDAALTALNDPDCRDLLAAATDEARTAGELIDSCGLARSTGYRKIDRLADAGLFEEGVRLRPDGGHASEYRRAVAAVTVSLRAADGHAVDTSTGAVHADD